MNLNLTLHRPDGSVLQLGAATTIRQVTTEHNGAVLICQMTSDTFRRAPQRNCSAGPLIITQVTSEPPPLTNPKSSLPPGEETPSKSTSSYVNVLIAPIIIATISIMGNVFQLWKNHQLKKIIASHKEKVTNNKGVDGPYMELQKTSKPASEEYMDLNRGTVGSDDQGRKYENIAESAHGNDSATNYEVVDTGLKN